MKGLIPRLHRDLESKGVPPASRIPHLESRTHPQTRKETHAYG